MKNEFFRLVFAALITSIYSATGFAAAFLESSFSTDTEGWRTAGGGATLQWKSSGTNSGGYIEGKGTNVTWFFTSPTAWSGNWQSVKTISLDLSIVSGHYSDAERTNMVVIVGTNGAQMTWTGDAPLWTWSHFDISVTPDSFRVDQPTFNSILSGVAEIRIRGEYTSGSETVGLDNVQVLTNTPTALSGSLVSRFTSSLEDWRPVDDVTLSRIEEGYPAWSLYARDWRDGRNFKIASPLAWAGDWRHFKQLVFDMKWTGSSEYGPSPERVKIFGANGQTLSWYSGITSGNWVHHIIPLSPTNFGVSTEVFESVMSHVSQLYIFGEFGGGDDTTWLDNVMLVSEATKAPALTNNLISRFHSDTEGWLPFDGGSQSWSTNGFSGGCLSMTDNSGGSMRFQAPESWAGDWRNFKQVRFMLKTLNTTRAGFDSGIEIVTWDGSSLQAACPPPYNFWTPYSVSLTPATFNVTQEVFEHVISNVASIRINGDVRDGYDTTLLDNVMVLMDDAPGIYPARQSRFDTGTDDWRSGEWAGSGFKVFTEPPDYLPTNGLTSGCIGNADIGNITCWFSPETWAGDWRSLSNASFDLKITQGSNMYTNDPAIWIISAYGNLQAYATTAPVPGVWSHQSYSFSTQMFNVSRQQFDQIMGNVASLVIRSEWINNSEYEILDNVSLDRALDPYADWLAQHFSQDDLSDPSLVARTADPDHDGVLNWNEYVAGTSPVNPADLLRLDLHRVSNQSFQAEWNSILGRRYQLEKSPNTALNNAWQETGQTWVGDGTRKSAPLNETNGMYFYRLKVTK